MSDLYQPGHHPDADQLSAFAEDALPAHERAQTLAHLAGCANCRMIVSLALPPIEDVPQLEPTPARRPWFYGWNVAWLAGPGLAALILLTIHIRNAAGPGNIASAPTQTADAHPPAVVAPPTFEAPKAAAPPAAKVPAAAPAQISAEARVSGGIIENQSVTNLPIQNRYLAQPQQQMQQQTIQRNYLNSAIAGGAANNNVAPLPEQRSDAISSFHGTITANGTGQPIAPAPAPVATFNQLQPLPVAPPPPATAAAPQRSASTTLDGALSDDTASFAAASIESLPIQTLPSHLAIASIVTRANRTLALDTHGTLFLSTDSGSHWKAVATQWPGRAVKVDRVSYPPQATDSLAKLSVDADSNASSTIIKGRNLQSSLTASISGTVTDSSGASIPGASIVITDPRTAIARTTKSDRAGYFSASNLAPDPYQIDVTSPGFEAQRTTITLAAAQQSIDNFSLKIGAASESINVSAAEPITLPTEESARATRDKKAAKAPKIPAAVSPPAVFEITTDTGELWTSADGQTWKRK
jgi:hypothetical protein